MTNRKKEIGACGNYCASCLDYIALVKDDDKLRNQVRGAIKKEMNIDVPLQEIGCEGCWGSIHNPWTASLDCKIRQCVETKGFATCAECDDFPCGIFTNQFASNSEYANNIRAIQKLGLEEWINKKESPTKGCA